MKWVCTVCGYVHEGDTAPEKCPVCKVPADKFVAQEEGKVEWADQHVRIDDNVLSTDNRPDG